MNYGGMTNIKMKISEIDQPLSISLIRLDLTEPAHVRHDSDRIIDSLQVKPAYPLYGAYTVVGTKTRLIINSNVVDID